MQLRVAVAHVSSRAGDSTGNLATISRLAHRASSAGAGLLVLPQAFLTGPVGDAASVSERALLSDDAALRDLAAIARVERIAILCGYLEACTGRQHDSALFVDHLGCALANYRRSHFRSGGDPSPLARGQWLTVVPFADAKLGVLIGADIEAPEPAQALTLAGANILLVLGSHGAEASIVGDAVLSTRAFENSCAVAYANGGGGSDAPRSRLLGTRGELLAVADSELAVANMPLAATAGPGSREAERRPQLYQKLAALPCEEAAPRD